MYHGFSDPDISPINSINYFNDVVRNFTGSPSGIPTPLLQTKTEQFFRLFMVPGMQHCSGGPGADQFDMLTALEQWVEQGRTGSGHGVESSERRGAIHAAAVSVPAVAEVQRRGQCQRRSELELR